MYKRLSAFGTWNPHFLRQWITSNIKFGTIGGFCSFLFSALFMTQFTGDDVPIITFFLPMGLCIGLAQGHLAPYFDIKHSLWFFATMIGALIGIVCMISGMKHGYIQEVREGKDFIVLLIIFMTSISVGQSGVFYQKIRYAMMWIVSSVIGITIGSAVAFYVGEEISKDSMPPFIMGLIIVSGLYSLVTGLYLSFVFSHKEHEKTLHQGAAGDRLL